MDPSSTTKKLGLNDRINQIWATTQGKTYTTAVATVAIVVVMVVFAVVPAYTSITDQIALNDKKGLYLEDVVDKQKALNTLVSQRNEQNTAITLLDLYVGSKINNELLVASFSSLTNTELFPDTTCTLGAASFSDPAVTKNFTTMNPNIKAIGFSVTFKNCKIDYEHDIDNVRDMYSRILNLPIPIYVTSINYTNKTEQSSGVFGKLLYNKFTLIITGEYYYWPKTTTSTTTTDE